MPKTTNTPNATDAMPPAPDSFTVTRCNSGDGIVIAYGNTARIEWTRTQGTNIPTISRIAFLDAADVVRLRDALNTLVPPLTE